MGEADAELTVAVQAERVEAAGVGDVAERVAPAAGDLRHLGAHEVEHLAGQVLGLDAVVAQLSVHAGAEGEHATVHGEHRREIFAARDVAGLERVQRLQVDRVRLVVRVAEAELTEASNSK